MKSHVLAFVFCVASAVGLAFAVADCGMTPKQDVALSVKVADELCQELADAGVSVDWVLLGCKNVDAVGGVVQVLLPRPEWAAIKARHAGVVVDAGPGK